MRSKRISERIRLKAGKVAVAALLAGALLSCEERPLLRDEGYAGPDPYDVRVVDAEIVIVDGRRIKLSNVDAPALVPSARCWAEGIAARDAVAFLHNLVKTGRTVEVRLDGPKDAVGHSLARVLIDGVDVGDAMYEQSLVARPTAAPFRWCEPMSRAREGAPPMNPLLSVSR